MTREAISELKKYTSGRKNTEKVEISVLQLNRVIKALEQEPCGDAVDKAKAIMIASGYCHPANIAKELAKLPPVNPQPCKDAISREWLKTAMHNFYYGLKHTPTEEDIQAYIDAAPLVTPQPKTGHWIYDNIANNWRCDKCGETPKTMGYVGTADFMSEHFRFCNHCGAKMVEPQESEYRE